MYLEDLGDKIRERRKRLGISQQELAEAAGYTSKVAISRIESGNMNLTMDKLVAIANYLNIPITELLHADKAEPDRTLPLGAFHGGDARPDLFPVIEELKELEPSDVARVMAYIRAIRSIRTWRQLSGMESDGELESALMAPLDLSQVHFLDEEVVKKLSDVHEKTADSLRSFDSKLRGEDTSKKSKP